VAGRRGERRWRGDALGGGGHVEVGALGDGTNELPHDAGERDLDAKVVEV